MAFIKPDLKYCWICTECIKTHGKNCEAIIQGNNIKNMKKLIKLHCNDENHKLAVACNIFLCRSGKYERIRGVFKRK